uniref:Uncharacterized protein n=1 Tax=Cacopsylla melanoneura TaxID=428564 RepID=A0A8D8YVJ9_9HEMI
MSMRRTVHTMMLAHQKPVLNPTRRRTINGRVVYTVHKVNLRKIYSQTHTINGRMVYTMHKVNLRKIYSQTRTINGRVVYTMHSQRKIHTMHIANQTPVQRPVHIRSFQHMSGI